MSENFIKNQQIITQYVLDTNGYSFQSAVLNQISTLYKNQEIRFSFYAGEYPITINNHSTLIDCVLRLGNIFLIGECKRKYNFKEWCFFQMPFTSSTDGYSNRKLIDALTEERKSIISNRQSIQRTLSWSELKGGILQNIEDSQVYTLGIAVENIESLRGAKFGSKLSFDVDDTLVKKSISNLSKEDIRKFSDDSIHQAVNQSLLGTGGFINSILQRPLYSSSYVGSYNFHFFSAVFTNANLYVSDVDLTDSNLDTGNLNKEINLKSVDYVWFNQNRSQEFAPNVNLPVEDKDFRDFVINNETSYREPEQVYSRTALIINSNSIKRALSLPFEELVK